MTVKERKKWRKVLYEDQGVPDNYVDDSFLDEMKKNVNTRTYKLQNVIIESGVVSQQLSSICLFIVTFIYMEEGTLSPQLLFTVGSLMTVFGYLLHDIVDGRRNRKDRTRMDDMKTICLFLAVSFGLSPILKNLTDSISTDTIYAMTVFMFLGNLLFHDYGTTGAVTSDALSLNAAIFGSVCLASRLPTIWHTFSTIAFAIQVFALWPVLRRTLKRHIPYSQLMMTWLLATVTMVALFTVKTVGAVLFLIGHFSITFLFPFWLIKLQPYKNNIHGPWDEAVIKDIK
ncbi:phosphatidylinositol N-acetylglucosaminyltransferase subunit C-like [Saccoglossus kowalevskii]|uniref:Phosphatidylinositol N-acetylglucosaminyltransferase subunit C-like n=1 Tax=Saccoglossus kowalevskii TaxID=10224 RepID=A0ABM0GLS8_SACKO|nr:PREDICTED: phosphatidylinositol N-acetylglucosaminyltransferase subunit C-like [Saccoglossus kowalevskii]